jgi:hypothetical protein
VAQSEGPEFKPQYHQKKKKVLKVECPIKSWKLILLLHPI